MMRSLVLAAGLVATAVAKPPNVLLILADDLGWSDLGCMGSEIPTPHLDRLAAEGASFRQFYNAARCCPTRASLLTGLFPHQAGMGGMVVEKVGRSEPGAYQGYLATEAMTLAEALKPEGYRCYLSGKWHVGEFRPHWPVDRGFDRSWSLISGAMNYYDLRKDKSPGLERVFASDAESIIPPADGRYITEEFTRTASGYLRDHRQQHPGQPWFLYLAYTAPHWPLHAPEEMVQKHLPAYRQGWQPIREARHRRQIQRGLLPPDTPLTPPDGAEWESLSPESRALMTRKMALYAAMIEVMDTGIGRIFGELEQAGELDDTLVIFLSDNGACAEGGLLGQNFRPDLTGEIGTVDSYHNYGRSWSNASNTPFRRHKSHTHEGGIRTPFLVRWPGKVKPGTMIDAVGHIIDVMPTLCEAAGAKPPAALPGRSLVPLWKDAGNADPRSLGWEHFGAAAWRHGDWKIVRPQASAAWELYDLSSDPCETRDRAAAETERVREMAAEWEKWAREMGVK